MKAYKISEAVRRANAQYYRRNRERLLAAAAARYRAKLGGVLKREMKQNANLSASTQARLPQA